MDLTTIFLIFVVIVVVYVIYKMIFGRKKKPVPAPKPVPSPAPTMTVSPKSVYEKTGNVNAPAKSVDTVIAEAIADSAEEEDLDIDPEEVFDDEYTGDSDVEEDDQDSTDDDADEETETDSDTTRS